VTQTYLNPQATTVPITSRVASAAGRLGSNGVIGSCLGAAFVVRRLQRVNRRKSLQQLRSALLPLQ